MLAMRTILLAVGLCVACNAAGDPGSADGEGGASGFAGAPQAGQGGAADAGGEAGAPEGGKAHGGAAGAAGGGVAGRSSAGSSGSGVAGAGVAGSPGVPLWGDCNVDKPTKCDIDPNNGPRCVSVYLTPKTDDLGRKITQCTFPCSQNGLDLQQQIKACEAAGGKCFPSGFDAYCGPMRR